MSKSISKKRRQFYMTVGIFFIIVSIGMLIYVFFLQWQNSVMS